MECCLAFIELDNVTYTYPVPGAAPQPALRGISLRIAEGEYVAIVGANGSGKSTLARMLNALLLPTGGAVRVAGWDTRDAAAHQEIRRIVGMVFQRPEDQLVAATVAEDVAFGPENLGLPPADIRARVEEALETVGMADLWERPPTLLSAGQMQRVALAGVLAMRPRCIVFDEATAMLDPGGRRAVRAMLRRMHTLGLTLVVVTHFMEEAVDADRVIVLERGRVALDDAPAAVFSNAQPLHALGLTLPPVAVLAESLRARVPTLPPGLLTIPALAAALDALPHHAPPLSPIAAPPPSPPAAPLIDMRHLAHTYLAGTPLASPSLRDASLTVAAGGAHGLLGATGAGKSTLMQHLNALLRPQSGAVRVGDFDLNDPAVDVRAVRRYVGLSFQMPEMQIFEQYVGDEIAYGPRLLGLTRTELRARVRWAMTLVGLDFDAFKDRLTFTLSGGERRKVALAATLALQPAILLLDEPTAGLDPAARADLLDRLAALRETGVTLLLSSHQMEDVARLTEQVTALAQGVNALSGPVNEVFAQSDTLHALGLDTPVIGQLVDVLRARGWSLPPTSLSVDDLCSWLLSENFSTD